MRSVKTDKNIIKTFPVESVERSETIESSLADLFVVVFVRIEQRRNHIRTVQALLTVPATDRRLFVEIVFRRVLEERRVAHVDESRFLVTQLAVFSLHSVRRSPVNEISDNYVILTTPYLTCFRGQGVISA